MTDGGVAPDGPRGTEGQAVIGAEGRPARTGAVDAEQSAGCCGRNAGYEEVGLSRREAAWFVDEMIEAICERLSAGEAVKTSSFGSFIPLDKGPRRGRNPKTGEAAPIPARRVVVFQPSRILKDRVNGRISHFGDVTPARR